jgi:hypothetical protein
MGTVNTTTGRFGPESLVNTKLIKIIFKKSTGNALKSLLEAEVQLHKLQLKLQGHAK